MKATKIWDMLRISLFNNEKNSITFVYDTTEVAPHYQLMKARRVHTEEDSWPEVEIISYNETEVRLKMDHQRSQTSTYVVREGVAEEEALDNANEIVVRIGQEPYKVYVFDHEEAIRGCLVFDFMSFTYQVDAHDEGNDQNYHFLIEDADWEAACLNDAEGTWRVAESIAEQAPEAVHIIKNCLEKAASLGCSEAQKRLQGWTIPEIK